MYAILYFKNFFLFTSLSAVMKKDLNEYIKYTSFVNAFMDCENEQIDFIYSIYSLIEAKLYI